MNNQACSRDSIVGIVDVRTTGGSRNDDLLRRELRISSLSMIAADYLRKGIYSGSLPDVEDKVESLFDRFSSRCVQLVAFGAVGDNGSGYHSVQPYATLSLFIGRVAEELPSALEGHWKSEHVSDISDLASSFKGHGPVGEVGKFASSGSSLLLSGLCAAHLIAEIHKEAYANNVKAVFLSTNGGDASRYSRLFGFQGIEGTLHNPDSVGKKECMVSYIGVERVLPVSIRRGKRVNSQVLPVYEGGKLQLYSSGNSPG